MVGLTVAYQYQTINELYVFSSTLSSRLYKIKEKGYLFRFIYIVVVAATAFLFPVQKDRDETKKWMYTFTTIILAAALLVGFTPVSSIYNLIIFPIVWIGYTLMVVYTIPYFLTPHIESDKSIFGISDEESDFYFRLETQDGVLRIHKPQQNICLLYTSPSPRD